MPSCPNCHTRCDPDDRFCPECGSALPPVPPACPHCSEPAEPGDRFCCECGRPLGGH